MKKKSDMKHVFIEKHNHKKKQRQNNGKIGTWYLSLSITTTYMIFLESMCSFETDIGYKLSKQSI